MPFGFSFKGAKGFKYGKTYGQGIRQMLRTGVNKNGSHEMSIKKKLKFFWFPKQMSTKEAKDFNKVGDCFIV